MTFGPLQRLLDGHVPLILDGAMGTELHRRGVDVSLPLWSAHALVTDPETVLQIHRDYLGAGAEILTTNTFRTTARTFLRARQPDRSRELTRDAVQLAKQARDGVTDRTVLIAGSLAPLEDCYRPDLVPSDAELWREHREQAQRLALEGVDVLLLETTGTIREAVAAAMAARETGLEVILSFLCRTDGRLYGGEDLAEAVAAVEPASPDALSVNCIPARALTAVLRKLRSLTSLPLAAYGNAGVAGEEQSGVLHRAIDPATYATLAEEWYQTGARIIGGCCGTGPDTIAALRILKERHAP